LGLLEEGIRLTVSITEGDIIWQCRMPGGYCLVLNVFHGPPHDQVLSDQGWADQDYPILRLLHPSEGVINDPDYYYDTLQAGRTR
jgi:hypothetical protein